MKKKEIDNELLRLAIITLLVATMFGVLQYFGDKTFETIGIDAILKTVALVLLKVPFLIFIFYVILMGLNLRYEKRKEFLKLKAFIYDLGIDMTIFVICFAILFAGLVWLLVKFPIIPMKLIVGVIWAFIILVAVIFYREIMKHIRK